jgi:Protein of unknown function (DUF1264)
MDFFKNHENFFRKNKIRTGLSMVVIAISMVALVVGGATITTRPLMMAALAQGGSIPGIVVSNNNSTTNTTNATAAAAAAAAKPVDGYNTPEGHVSAIRHIFDDPSLRVQHYCKPNDKVVLVCQLYDRDSNNATLIGVEYVITADQYKSLPEREKPNWHFHKIELSPNRADPMFPELTADQAKAGMQKLMDTYGKVIITWNPKDNLPAFPAQVQQVEHPFMVNATVKPEVHAGSFNQTLKY